MRQLDGRGAASELEGGVGVEIRLYVRLKHDGQWMPSTPQAVRVRVVCAGITHWYRGVYVRTVNLAYLVDSWVMWGDGYELLFESLTRKVVVFVF